MQRTQSRLEDLEGLILGQWLKWLHPDWEGPNPAPTELGHNLSDLPVFWDWLHEVKLPEFTRDGKREWPHPLGP